MFVTLGKWEGWVKRVLQKHINIESYFSIDSGASRLGSGWGPFPHFHTAIFYLHLHMVLSRKNKLSPVSSYKGTNSIMIALSTRPNHLPKAPSLNSITLGTMVSNLNGGGGCKWAVHDSWQSFTIFSSRQPLTYLVTGVTKAKVMGILNVCVSESLQAQHRSRELNKPRCRKT